MRSSEKTIKLMIASHFGEPPGGISAVNEALINSRLNSLVILKAVATSSGKLFFVDRGQFSPRNILNAISNIRSFIKTFQNFKPDVVDFGTSYRASFLKHGLLAIYARFHHAKVIMTFHCSKNKIFTGSFWMEKFARTVLMRCDGISAISQEWLTLKEKFPHLKIRYIPNAVDTTKIIEISQVKKNIPTILYLGHLGEDKGTYDLLKAASLLLSTCCSPREPYFLIILHGESLSTGDFQLIETEIKRLGLSECVILNPPIYGSAKWHVMGSANIVVLPSHHEGMPMIILEAMALGLPVVATNVGGIPDQVIDWETGLLVPPSDPEALANALKILIESDKLRIDMGHAARERAVEVFDIERKVDALMDLYTSVNAN